MTDANETKQTAAWTVDVADFSGPLDLLLRLIKAQDIDIFDIPMATVTAQYIDFLKAHADDLDEAGDYLVMAAVLIETKTAWLLPKPKKETAEAEDPRQPLVERLLLYQAYQQITGVLAERQKAQQNVYWRAPADMSRYQAAPELAPGEVTVADLVAALERFVRRIARQAPAAAHVDSDPYAIETAMADIESAVRDADAPVSLFTIAKAKQWTRSGVATLFLALLQLVKERAVVFEQDAPTDEIVIEARKAGNDESIGGV